MKNVNNFFAISITTLILLAISLMPMQAYAQDKTGTDPSGLNTKLTPLNVR